MATMKFFNVLDVPSEGAVDGTYYVKNGDYIDTYLVSSGKVERLSAESLRASYDDRVTQVESDITQLADEVNAFSLKNTFENGNFLNPTTDGWASIYASLSVENNMLKINTITGATVRVYKITNIPVGVKIYARIKLLAFHNESGFSYIGLRDGHNGEFFQRINNPVHNKWYVLSGVKETTENTIYIYSSKSTPTVNSYQLLKEVTTINLTSVFGAGNEPSKSEMDVLFDVLPNDWFDGEMTVTQKIISNWHLKMIRQNRSAIIALGGTII